MNFKKSFLYFLKDEAERRNKHRRKFRRKDPRMKDFRMKDFFCARYIHVY